MSGSATIEYYHRSRLLRRIPVTEDFFRISSSPDAAVLVPGLENYAVTIDVRNTPYRVKSRSDRLVSIGGKAVEREVWTEWPAGLELAIDPGLSFKVRSDVASESDGEAASAAGTAAFLDSGAVRGATGRAVGGGSESRTTIAEAAAATDSKPRLMPWHIVLLVVMIIAAVGLSWSDGVEIQAGKQSEENLGTLLSALMGELDAIEGQGEHLKDQDHLGDAIRFRFALNQLRYARYLEQQDRHEEKKAVYKVLWERCDLEHAKLPVDVMMREYVELKK